MGFRVIADRVAPRGHLASQFRTFPKVAPDQKESRLRVMLRKQIEQLGGDRRIRTVVESNCQLARRIRPANCWPEELRARVHAAISGKSRSGADHPGNSDEPRIHGAILARTRRRRKQVRGPRAGGWTPVAPQPGSRRRVFRSLSNRSTSMSRSMRVSRSPASSVIISTSAVATDSL